MMQRNYGFVCWVLITFIFCLTTPCKAVDKNKLNIRPFHKLEVKGDVEVEIIQSDQCGILIVAQDNYRDLVDIEQNDNVLTISMHPTERAIFYTTGTNKVVVYTDDFKKLRVSGESDVRIPKPFYFKDSLSLEKKGSGDFDGIIKVDDFRLNAKGSGSLQTTVKCLDFDLNFSGSGNHKIQITDALKGKIITSGSGNVDADIFSKVLDSKKSGSGELHLDLLTKTHTLNKSGSGKVKIKGKAYESYINSTNSGDVSAKDFETVISCVKITGSGHTSVNAKERLNAILSSSGSLYYRGAPKVKTQKHGSGSVKHIN
ncbi:MAG: DUF2807 domain-containing protein [Prolixibacteraceae bacterium]|jgi:hypothetical protein|nr:DUF2807 domain-containing protein [Prolixibacteraceae bacterium]